MAGLTARHGLDVGRHCRQRAQQRLDPLQKTPARPGELDLAARAVE